MSGSVLNLAARASVKLINAGRLPSDSPGNISKPRTRMENGFLRLTLCATWSLIEAYSFGGFADRLLVLFGLPSLPFGARALLNLVFCDDLIGVFDGEL